MSRLQRRTCALMRKDSPLQQDRVAGCEQDKSTGVGQKKDTAQSHSQHAPNARN
jgi:hypothetical protein